MDFGQFDSRAAGDKGAWMHVTNPFDGDPMHDDGKPCRVKVLGIEGEVGQGLFDDVRKGMKGQADDKGRIIRETIPLVVGFENIDRGDKPAIAPGDVEWFLSLQHVVGGDHPSFVEQVRAFAIKRANFLGNVSGGSSKPLNKSDS